MIALVSAHRDRKGDGNFSTLIRAELSLFVGLGTVSIFLGTGSRLVEITAHPVALIVVFLWLFAVILWSAVSVARHADCLAVKWGEPYGTLVLTLSAIAIEVVMVSTAMLHGENNPTLGRDAIFSVMMIALNGFVGLSLLIGGLRHREQYYNLQGVNSYLNVIMTLAVLGLVLPDFTTTTGGPTFSTEQQIFLIVVSLVLYAIFLVIQTMRHRGYFMESEQAGVAASPGHHSLHVQSTAFHAPMLLLYLIVVILLAEKFAIPLDNSIEQVWHASGVWRRNDCCSGAYTRGNWRCSGHFAQSVAAVDKHSARFRACDDRTYNSRRADYQPGHETTGDARSPGRQPSTAAVNAGGVRGYVYEQKDKCPAGLRSLASLRGICAADLCTLSCSPRCGRTDASGSCLSRRHFTRVFALRWRSILLQQS